MLYLWFLYINKFFYVTHCAENLNAFGNKELMIVGETSSKTINHWKGFEIRYKLFK